MPEKSFDYFEEKTQRVPHQGGTAYRRTTRRIEVTLVQQASGQGTPKRRSTKTEMVTSTPFPGSKFAEDPGPDAAFSASDALARPGAGQPGQSASFSGGGGGQTTHWDDGSERYESHSWTEEITPEDREYDYVLQAVAEANGGSRPPTVTAPPEVDRVPIEEARTDATRPASPLRVPGISDNPYRLLDLPSREGYAVLRRRAPPAPPPSVSLPRFRWPRRSGPSWTSCRSASARWRPIPLR